VIRCTEKVKNVSVQMFLLCETERERTFICLRHRSDVVKIYSL